MNLPLKWTVIAVMTRKGWWEALPFSRIDHIQASDLRAKGIVLTALQRGPNGELRLLAKATKAGAALAQAGA